MTAKPAGVIAFASRPTGGRGAGERLHSTGEQLPSETADPGAPTSERTHLTAVPKPNVAIALPTLAEEPRRPLGSPPPRRSFVGTGSLLVALVGAVASRVVLHSGLLGDAVWLRIVAAGFEAAVVGGLADWFAVTALFRHPLGLPIPHTNIILSKRDKLIDSIESIIENDWLSPQVISARLKEITPSRYVVEWLGADDHFSRVSGPVRDLLRAFARILREDDVAQFLEHTLRRQLGEIPIDASLGTWLSRICSNEAGGPVFETLALSAANLASRPRTTGELQWWLERSARKLRESGRVLVPFVLRRKVVQRKIVEAACAYASAELRSAAEDPHHPLRRAFFEGVAGYAARLASGDPPALEQAERLRRAILDSLESGTLVRDALRRLQDQLDRDLANPTSALSTVIDKRLRSGILDLLSDPERQARFDRWVQTTADDLVRRHHHEIGRTVREHLRGLDPRELVRQVEERVGADLQFIRLNGAVVGGLIGLSIALAHWLAG